MIDQTISRRDARHIYDNLGHALDRAERFEARAKELALNLLAAGPGQQVLHVGVGTGAEHAALQHAVAPNGLVVGCDLSRGMLQLTRLRADTPLCEGDAARLPFQTHRFDRLFSAYMLDLLPLAEIPLVLAEFRRVLQPGGQLVLVSLTTGVDVPSRCFVAGWTLLYRIAPQRLGGCRPLQLSDMLQQAGFAVERHVVVQRGFPSEVLLGRASKIQASGFRFQ
ncbi:methyltransferase domain-containing protein [Candidatus Gracilibacteria bacterium]|nr:methyltransferase domain-containing protein [Candidatus Gracilibacteria bacterium]